MIRFLFPGGKSLSVGADFFAVMALWWTVSGAGYFSAVSMLAAVAAHELGHLAALFLTHIPVRETVLDLRGITIRPKEGLYPEGKELFFVLAGPVTSLLLAWIFSLLKVPFVWTGGQLAAAVYSLFPFPGTDGWETGQILGRDFDK